MERYFIRQSSETLEVYLSQPVAIQPENSILFVPGQNYNFVRTGFDQWPPTKVQEIATLEEIADIKTPLLMQKLQDVATDLRMRAKRAAIDKTGDDNYIQSQEELYRIKKEVAEGSIVNEAMTLLMHNEADEFGLTYEEFCALIISKFNAAENLYKIFLYMIERCRTKIQTLIEGSLFDQAEAAFALVDTLNNADQAEGLMAQILAI